MLRRHFARTLLAQQGQLARRGGVLAKLSRQLLSDAKPPSGVSVFVELVLIGVLMVVVDSAKA